LARGIDNAFEVFEALSYRGIYYMNIGYVRLLKPIHIGHGLPLIHT